MSTRIRLWISDHKRELAFIIVVFLVSSISFGLGYLAHEDLNHTPIVIERQSP